jgi:hypothetical protein
MHEEVVEIVHNAVLFTSGSHVGILQGIEEISIMEAALTDCSGWKTISQA